MCIDGELWGDDGLGLARQRRIARCLTLRSRPLCAACSTLVMVSRASADLSDRYEDSRRDRGEGWLVDVCFSLMRNEAVLSRYSILNPLARALDAVPTSQDSGTKQ